MKKRNFLKTSIDHSVNNNVIDANEITSQNCGNPLNIAINPSTSSGQHNSGTSDDVNTQ